MPVCVCVMTYGIRLASTLTSSACQMTCLAFWHYLQLESIQFASFCLFKYSTGYARQSYANLILPASSRRSSRQQSCKSKCKISSLFAPPKRSFVRSSFSCVRRNLKLGSALTTATSIGMASSSSSSSSYCVMLWKF